MTQLGTSPGQISLHQQAAPLVSGQVLDRLTFLAKFYPGAFWPTKLAVAEGGKGPRDLKDSRDIGQDDKEKDTEKNSLGLVQSSNFARTSMGFFHTRSSLRLL
jgi:hypothetical protein